MKKVSKSEIEAQRVSDIVNRKKVVLSNLNLLRNHLFSIAYKGIVNKSTNLEVKSELLRAFNQNRWGRYKDLSLVNESFEYFLKNKGKSEQYLLKNMVKDNNFRQANAIKNKIANKFERDKKEKCINELMDNARQDKTVFYLCSAHTHPAKDHKDHQGKIYVDAKWRDYMQNVKETNKVYKYIKSNNTTTIQKITSAPTYMIYRPYCKHYFVPISTSVVLKNGGRDATFNLLKQYGALRDEQNTNRKDYTRRKLLENVKFFKKLPDNQFTRFEIARLNRRLARL